MALSSSVSASNVSNKESIYEKAEAYWSQVSCDVDGMLGGFAKLHLPDIVDSKKFLRILRNKKKLLNFERAIDCGCGIGRVTKYLLLPQFKSVDMVDIIDSFIESSSSYIGEEDKRVRQKFICGLQDFEPQENYYDMIWIQWVTGHLTDEDLVSFLKRCQNGLREGGCIVLKENVTSSDTYDFDTEDNSWTRPRNRILELVKEAGLTLLCDRKQTNFPQGMLSVYMFAFR
uniref:Alpha N-terminal protein methyltransferase 1 n=1 Tax=Syphacia muris TaxID=451379 RepID=A0A0N5AHC2_9BILA